jgi:LPS-assembly protein
MRKIVVIGLFNATMAWSNDQVWMIGEQVDANGSIVHSTTYPTLIYQDQVVSAQTLTYDNNTSVVEAFGQVNAFKGGKYHTISEYSRLNLTKETRYLKPYYSIDANSSAWISAVDATGCQSRVDLSKGMVSGCNSNNPLWKIHFTSANYDTQSQWVNMYNALLYVKDVPVMYLPYFGYPTDNTRRSGLLIPTFGFSNGEGFYYQQPLYLAPKNWWDLELRPQIRTSRGEGVYGDFRFVDGANSKGSIRFGYFKEQEAYALAHNLAFKKHYGYNLDYRNSALLSQWFGINLSGESGLYVRTSRISDVDYLNLQHSDQIYNVTSNQVISRVNSYYNGEKNYFGLYAKYYQYLDQSSNARTIQTLPEIHYHRYLESLLGNHLLINGDATVTNFYRDEGKKGIQGDIVIPIALRTSLLNGYLDASYTANSSVRMLSLSGNDANLSNAGQTFNNTNQGLYAQLSHVFKLSSTLVRPYSTFTHVMAPEVSYSSAGSHLYSGYYKEYSVGCTVGNTDPACDFYTLNPPRDTLAFALNNYIMQRNKQVFSDRLSQNFYRDPTGNSASELQNEAQWQVTKSLSFYNQTAFNHMRGRITKEQNTVNYADGVLSASMSHYYTDTLLGGMPTYASYLTANANYIYNDNYKFFSLVAYDYHANVLKREEVGFLYTTRCLDFGLKFVQNIRPIVTIDNASNSVNDRYVYVTIIFKPLGGSMFNYHLTNN